VVVEVSLQVVFLCEGLGAKLARVRLDSRMQSHVECHVTSVGESFTAHTASKRLLTSVDAQMLFEQHLA
jgi:hypothetical protein